MHQLTGLHQASCFRPIRAVIQLILISRCLHGQAGKYCGYEQQ